MSENSPKSFLDRLPTEVLYLIFGQSCGHCRGADIGRLSDIDPQRHSICENENGDHPPSEDAPRRRSDREYVTKHWCEHHEVAIDGYREGKKSLASLCLVSKAMRLPAQSVLHHSYMNGRKHPVYQDPVQPIQYPAFLHYIKSIIHTPRLACYVRSLSLGNRGSTGSSVSNEKVAMPEASAFRGFLSSGGKPAPRRVTRLDVLERLIMALPQLTHLSIGELHVDYVDRDPDFFEQIEELPLTSIDVWIDPFGGAEGGMDAHVVC
ncbi:hypothetical protein PG984_016147 [Apiospora sp. TS-2023a]